MTWPDDPYMPYLGARQQYELLYYSLTLLFYAQNRVLDILQINIYVHSHYSRLSLSLTGADASVSVIQYGIWRIGSPIFKGAVDTKKTDHLLP